MSVERRHGWSGRVGWGVGGWRRWVVMGWVGWVGWGWGADGLLITAPRPGVEATPAPVAEGDLLQFLDGSSLHGRLEAVDPARGVVWRHPAARGPIEFRPANLAWIRFEHALPVTNRVVPDCRFRFHNGDEIPGRLVSLDGEKVEFQTWFGGRLQAARSTVDRLLFSSRGFDVLYEGPNGMEDWKQGKGVAAWQFRDGALTARTVGSIGRDFKLPERSALSFDLAWNGQFNLMVTYYTSVLDRFDYTSSSYMFSIGYGYLSLQRIQANFGTAIMGQVLLQDMQRRNRMRLELRASRPEQTIAVLVDGVLVQKWHDMQGFAGAGTGVAFFAQQNGPSVRVSNLRLTEWDGRFEADVLVRTNEPPPTSDLTFLVNGDRAQGAIRSIRDGKVGLMLGERALDIPLGRVTHVVLSGGVTNTAPRDPWEIRAFFAHGGTLAFTLDRWSEGEMGGRNGNFGAFTFDPRSVRQLQFNLDRSGKADRVGEAGAEEYWDEDE